MKYLVKFYGLLLFFCISCFVVKAQQKHFMYVQSEDRQPFAIVLNGKVYSSSDYGYIIIPKLEDGDYNFTVSFPMNKFPDQSFACSINKKDAGYFLKNSTDGWALENMQTQKLIMNGTAKTTQQSAFGNMLADVVNDSTLTKANTTTAAAPATENPAVTGSVIDNAPAASGAAVAGAVVATGNEVSAATSSPGQLEKIGEIKADTGTNMLFVDKSQNSTDTINVFIPAEPTKKTETVTEAVEQNTAANTVTQDSLATASFQNNNAAATENANAPAATATNNEPSATVTEKSATDVSNPFYKPEDTKAGVAAAAIPVETQAENTAATAGSASTTNNAVGSVKQGCENMLSDDDLNKLKRKMFSQNGDDAMVQYAVKSVSKKCISTDQVKALGSLFSSDDGRYNLYDALYKHVYDYNNYPSLANQILDPYYKKRFAALLR